MPITVNAPVPETRYLGLSDPAGDTFVIVRQPDFAAEIMRQKALERRTLVKDGDMLAQRVEVNLADLWALEIWLTYQETNLVVEYLDKDGKIAETIKFEPREQMTRSEFMRRLEKLPTALVFDWHNQVIDVVSEWSLPF